MIELIEKHGIKFYARKGTSDIKSFDEVFSGGYTRKKPFLFDVSPQEIWIDLGANAGAFSLYALNRGARVISVEADPQNFEVAKKNLKKYESVNAVVLFERAVVADNRKEVTISQNTKNGNVWRNSIEKKWRGGSEVVVPCIHIADVIADNKNVCLKIDIEGTEMPILEWLVEQDISYIKNIKKIVFEWSFDVDPDLNRYRNVMKKLAEKFDIVMPFVLYEKYDKWQSSWFPPCKTIFCMNR